MPVAAKLKERPNTLTMQNTFFPDEAKAVDLRGQINERLIASLRYLLTEVEPFPPELEQDGLSRLAQLKPEVLDAALHGLHAALRNAALQGDRGRFDRLRHDFSQWTFHLARPDASGPVVRMLSAQDYDPVRLRVLGDGFADDVGLTTALTAPSPDLAKEQAVVVQYASSRIAEVTPQWHAEMRVLVGEIIFATNDTALTGRTFAGGSVFDLFGALLVNPAYRTGLPHYAMTLIHETAHLRLFCDHLDDPVVLNDDVARYTSPLRRQPRPMEGIFHATWVSARMAVFGSEFLQATRSKTVLTPDEQAGFSQQIASSIAAFHDGRAVIEAEGNLTEMGWQILRDATDAIGGLA